MVLVLALVLVTDAALSPCEPTPTPSLLGRGGMARAFAAFDGSSDGIVVPTASRLYRDARSRIST
jgi:hypothetical protein